MTKQEITEFVQGLIADLKYKEALETLSAYVKGRDRYIENDLLMQIAAFNRNSRDRANGLISQENYGIAESKLTYNLNEILPRLPENGNDVEVGNDAPNNAKTPQNTIRKILFLTANPRDTSQLRLGDELRKVKDGLAAATQRADFDLESEPAVQIPTITKAMLKQKPEIVHFSGHGGKERGLAVQDDNGDLVLFPTAGLDRLFKMFKDTVKCVVLNACYASEQAEVISKHGIYVVGMNDKVGDKAATNFSVGFYQSLGEGTDYEFAFNMAMVNIAADLKYADTPELWYNGEKLDI